MYALCHIFQWYSVGWIGVIAETTHLIALFYHCLYDFLAVFSPFQMELTDLTSQLSMPKLIFILDMQRDL